MLEVSDAIESARSFARSSSINRDITKLIVVMPNKKIIPAMYLMPSKYYTVNKIITAEH